jgi:hypothetical protein
MKREDGGSGLSKEQKEWIFCLNCCQGTLAKTAKGAEDAFQVINSVVGL